METNDKQDGAQEQKPPPQGGGSPEVYESVLSGQAVRDRMLWAIGCGLLNCGTITDGPTRMLLLDATMAMAKILVDRDRPEGDE